MTLALDGTAETTFSTLSSGNLTLTTTDTNDVVLVGVGFGTTIAQGAQTVANVTASGLTFTRRGGATYNAASGHVTAELWWAPSTGALTSEVITITLSGTIDDAAIFAIGVNGCPNISAPFDRESTLPTITTGAPAAAPIFWTAEINDLLISFGVTNYATGFAHTWTTIYNLSNIGGSNYCLNDSAYEIVSSIQRGATGGVNPGGQVGTSPGVIYLDALTAGGNQAQPLIGTI